VPRFEPAAFETAVISLIDRRIHETIETKFDKTSDVSLAARSHDAGG
jgi:hypothetical protein